LAAFAGALAAFAGADLLAPLLALRVVVNGEPGADRTPVDAPISIGASVRGLRPCLAAGDVV